jgi:hypothetical protein
MKSIATSLIAFFAIVSVNAQVPRFTKMSLFPIASTLLTNAIYENGKFIAVGDNAIAYSADEGETWLDGVGYPRIPYKAVIYGNGLFIAMGTGRQFASSADGVNWTLRDLPTSLDIGSLAFGNGTFAAAGPSGGFSSSDGISWSSVSQYASKVAFANGTFIFYVKNLLTPPNLSGYVLWMILDCVSTGTGFVCSTAWEKTGVPPGYCNYTSLDGQLWSISSPSDGSRFVALSPLYVIRGTVVGYSSLGGNLFGVLDFPQSSYDVPPTGNGFYAASDQTVICVGNNAIWRGPELGSWKRVAAPTEIPIVSGSAKGSLFVGIGNTNSGGTLVPRIIIATNGLPSTIQINAPGGSGALSAVRYADGKFVAVGQGGTVIRSSDGTNWTRRLSNTTSDLYDLVFRNGSWVAVGDAGKIVTSSDTSVFSLRSSGTEVPIFGITYGANQFVAVGKDGLILNSANGTDWSANGTDEARDLYSVAYGNNRFIAVGTNGIVHVSTNAVQWQATTIPNVTAFRRVTFGNGYFVALTSTNNMLFASKDGFNWSSAQISDVNLYGLDFSDNELWLTGEKSTIYKTSLGHAFAPTLRGEFDSKKGFVLTVQPAALGTYQIESTASLSPSTWFPVTTFNDIEAATSWTDTNSQTAARFYRVVRE